MGGSGPRLISILGTLAEATGGNRGDASGAGVDVRDLVVGGIPSGPRGSGSEPRLGEDQLDDGGAMCWRIPDGTFRDWGNSLRRVFCIPHCLLFLGTALAGLVGDVVDSALNAEQRLHLR